MTHARGARATRDVSELLVALTVAVGLLLAWLSKHIEGSVLAVRVKRAHTASTVVAAGMARRTGAGVGAQTAGSTRTERSGGKLARRHGGTGRRQGTADAAVDMVVVVLDLSRDATAIGSVADGGKDGADVLDETRLGLKVGVVDGSLNDVVGVRVA